MKGIGHEKRSEMELNKAYLAIPLTPKKDGFLSKSKKDITSYQAHPHPIDEALLSKQLLLSS